MFVDLRQLFTGFRSRECLAETRGVQLGNYEVEDLLRWQSPCVTEAGGGRDDVLHHTASQGCQLTGQGKTVGVVRAEQLHVEVGGGKKNTREEGWMLFHNVQSDRRQERNPQTGERGGEEGQIDCGREGKGGRDRGRERWRKEGDGRRDGGTDGRTDGQ